MVLSRGLPSLTLYQGFDPKAAAFDDQQTLLAAGAD